MQYTKPKQARFNPGTKNKLNDKNHICQIPTHTKAQHMQAQAQHMHIHTSVKSRLKTMQFCKTTVSSCSQCSQK